MALNSSKQTKVKANQAKTRKLSPGKKSPAKKNKRKEELRAQRSPWLLLSLVGLLLLAFYGFFSKQNNTPNFPHFLAEEIPRGLIRSRDGTVFAEGSVEHRRYPLGNIAAHIIGFSGKDQGNGRFGLEGLEFTLDTRLQAGENITITIDPRIQAIVQAQLKATIQKFEAENGSVIVLEAGTGRILAAASYPEYNPNRFKDASDYNNKAFRYLFEPGSVMKPFVVAAALETKRWSLDEALATPMTLRVGSQTFRDVAQHAPWLTLADVLRYSSNTGMIHLSETFSDEELYAWLSHFGFGRGLDVPSIYTQKGILRDTPWVPQDHASITIGQSISTTALQLAAAYSIFANDGMLVTPYLVEGDKTPAPQKRLEPETAETMLNLLRYAVERSGLAKGMAPGISVAGKSGTADVFDATAGEYLEDDYNVTFAGIFPAEKPKITMVVTVQKPRKSGSSTVVAAPLFGAITEEVAALYTLPVKPLAEVSRP